MIGLLGAVLQSRVACSILAVLAFLGGLYAWHTFDKSSAVRKAVIDYVAQAELTSARVQLEEQRRRRAVADKANRHLQTEIDQANADAAAAAEELEHYVSQVDDSCIVQPDLSDRLRAR